jgi:hypothetical protein
MSDPPAKMADAIKTPEYVSVGGEEKFKYLKQKSIDKKSRQIDVWGGGEKKIQASTSICLSEAASTHRDRRRPA